MKYNAADRKNFKYQFEFYTGRHTCLCVCDCISVNNQKIKLLTSNRVNKGTEQRSNLIPQQLKTFSIKPNAPIHYHT